MTDIDDSAGLLGQRHRRSRFVVEDVLSAFHHACDVRNREVAWRLIVAAENAMRFQDIQPRATKRVIAGKIVSAHQRLWVLFHGED